MSTSRDTSTESPASGRATKPRPSWVPTLDALVGAHPGMLQKLFREGGAADPGELGEPTRGLLLSVAAADVVFLAIRPVLRALSSGPMPWKGVVFDHGGNSGQNLILGKPRLRFRAEVAPSGIDTRPALRLLYENPVFGNPWPVRDVVGELRSIGPGLALGPVLFHGHILGWFGLSRS
jgi:hypothetical protein